MLRDNEKVNFIQKKINTKFIFWYEKKPSFLNI